MTETKKRIYQVESIPSPALKPTRQPATRGSPLNGTAEARRQMPQDGQPKQDLIIRLIDYLKSI
jgi:hypothetical protein